MAITVSQPVSSRSFSEFGLALLLGLAIIAAMLALPIEVGIAFIMVAAFGIFVLFDSWHAVLLLLIARSSLDVLSDVAIAGGLNGAALLTAMVVVIGVEHIARRRVRVLDVPLAKPFLAILAVTAAGILLAPDMRAAFEDWLRLLSTFLLFVLVLNELQDSRERGKFLTALLLSALLPVLVGLYQLATGGGGHVTGYNRIFATFAHPANFGVYLVMLTPVFAALLLQARPSWSKIAVAGLTVLMVVCTIFTYYRTVWIGLVIAALVMGAAKTRAALFVVPLVVFAALTLMPSVQGRLDGAFETSGYGSFAWRINLWGEELSHTTVSNVPLGSGFGTIESRTGFQPHNDYLRIWIETGFLGSAAFLWLYGSLVRRTLANYRQARSPVDRNLIQAFLALLAARMVMSLTDNLLSVGVLEWYFWALAAMALSIQPRRRTPSPLAEMKDAA